MAAGRSGSPASVPCRSEAADACGVVYLPAPECGPSPWRIVQGQVIGTGIERAAHRFATRKFRQSSPKIPGRLQSVTLRLDPLVAPVPDDTER